MNESFNTYMAEQLAGLELLSEKEIETTNPSKFYDPYHIKQSVINYNNFLSDMRDRIAAMPHYFDARRNFHAELANDMAKAGRILDAGCGTGLDACFLQSQHPEKKFFAYDLTEKNIRKARSRAAGVNFFIAEHDSPPFRKEEFDLIYCNHSLTGEDHFLHPTDVVKIITQRIENFSRHLRSRGKLVIAHDFCGEQDNTCLWVTHAAERAGLAYSGNAVLYEPDKHGLHGCVLHRFEKR